MTARRGCVVDQRSNGLSRNLRIKSIERGKRTAKNAAWVTLILGLAKGVVAYLSSSSILLAEAVHSLVDFLAAAASWLGMRLSLRKPDERFPFGLYKAENLAALAVSMIILATGTRLVFEGWRLLFHPHPLSLPFLAFGTALGAGVVSLILSIVTRKVGRQINSQSLTANATEYFIDVLTSLIVLCALVTSYLGIPYVEGAATIAVSIFILAMGVRIGWSSILSLLDIGPDEATVASITDEIMRIPGVKGVLSVRVRRSGMFFLGEAEIGIDRSLPVEKGHEIGEVIVETIREKFPKIADFMIHIDPYRARKQRVLIPIIEDKGLESQVSVHFGRAPFFLITNLFDGKTESSFVHNNTSFKKDIRAGLAAAQESALFWSGKSGRSAFIRRGIL
jgi:cation diffusion facilitator family transporter